MHISLTPELESRVRTKVDGGLYNNASEVIREALRFMETHDEWINELKLAALKKKLKVGTDQLDRGEGVVLQSKTELDDLFNNLID